MNIEFDKGSNLKRRGSIITTNASLGTAFKDS